MEMNQMEMSDDCKFIRQVLFAIDLSPNFVVRPDIVPCPARRNVCVAFHLPVRIRECYRLFDINPGVDIVLRTGHGWDDLRRRRNRCFGRRGAGARTHGAAKRFVDIGEDRLVILVKVQLDVVDLALRRRLKDHPVPGAVCGAIA